MKIADVSGFYSETGGGVASYVRQKLDLAARWGHEVVVIAPGATSRVEQRPGGRIVWVESPSMPFDSNYHMFVGAEEVWRVLDREAPDVVEGSSPWRGGWLAGHWSGRAVKSLIFHQDFIAGYPYTLLGGFLSRPAIDTLFAPYWSYVRRLSACFDATVTGGDWLAERLKGFGIHNPVSVPFGIETGLFPPKNANRPCGANCWPPVGRRQTASCCSPWAVFTPRSGTAPSSKASPAPAAFARNSAW